MIEKLMLLVLQHELQQPQHSSYDARNSHLLLLLLLPHCHCHRRAVRRCREEDRGPAARWPSTGRRAAHHGAGAGGAAVREVAIAIAIANLNGGAVGVTADAKTMRMMM